MIKTVMPSLGVMTINVLAAADRVLIPVQAAYLPVKGLQMLMKTIAVVKKRLNKTLAIEGILITMMNMQKLDVVAADGSKAIAMFKLPGGAVVAHGSQQPDRKKDEPEVVKETVKKEEPSKGSRRGSTLEKTKKF